jgi:Protein of unknown function (DUF1329)
MVRVRETGLLLSIFLLLMSRLSAAGYTSNMTANMSSTAANDHSTSRIAPGTRITIENWRQYSQFMPDGMQALFEGKYFWKMPVDVVLDVGPTVIHPLPKRYLEATEQGSTRTKLISMPDGRLNIEGYQGGLPFPDPAEPHIGWKILADFWFRYFPHLVVNGPDNLGFSCGLDSFRSVNCVKGLWVYRQLSFNTDPGIPTTIPGAQGKFYTSWFMVQEPEQQKYSATLTIGYSDLSRPEDVYTFVPALRRAQQLSTAARCAESGSDTTPDDGRFGFDGTLPDFNATLVSEKKILSQMDVGSAGSAFPDNYDMPLGWPKPSWGKWELRDVYVLDVRKIKSEAAGYCYGKRIMYIDRQFFGALWLDLYDAMMREWKFALLQPIVLMVPGIGLQNSTGAWFAHFWDIARNHATFSGPNDGHGYDVLINEAAPKQYLDLERYTTPAGLSEIMR